MNFDYKQVWLDICTYFKGGFLNILYFIGIIILAIVIFGVVNYFCRHLSVIIKVVINIILFIGLANVLGWLMSIEFVTILLGAGSSVIALIGFYFIMKFFFGIFTSIFR